MHKKGFQKNRLHITRRDIIKVRYLKEDHPEKKLWKLVICQAIEDATTRSRKRKMRCEKRKAVQWLTSNNSDFETVCTLAGCNAKDVQNNIAKLIRDSSENS